MYCIIGDTFFLRGDAMTKFTKVGNQKQIFTHFRTDQFIAKPNNLYQMFAVHQTLCLKASKMRFFTYLHS